MIDQKALKLAHELFETHIRKGCVVAPDFEKHIAAALIAAEAKARAAATVWEPIRTAYNDGRPVLLADAEGYAWVGYSSFGDDGFEWRSNDESAGDPVKWNRAGTDAIRALVTPAQSET